MKALCFFCHDEMEVTNVGGKTVRRCPNGHGNAYFVNDPATEMIGAGDLEPIAQATA